jgi:hypothetical protein
LVNSDGYFTSFGLGSLSLGVSNATHSKQPKPIYQTKGTVGALETGANATDDKASKSRG